VVIAAAVEDAPIDKQNQTQKQITKAEEDGTKNATSAPIIAS
jgi:hypothetical protein